MKKILVILSLSMFLLVPAHANDLLDDIKDAVEDEDRPGQHGRDNAEIDLSWDAPESDRRVWRRLHQFFRRLPARNFFCQRSAQK